MTIEVNIPFNLLLRAGSRLIPDGDKLKLMSHSIYCSDYVAELIPYEDKVKLISHSIHCSEWI